MTDNDCLDCKLRIMIVALKVIFVILSIFLQRLQSDWGPSQSHHRLWTPNTVCGLPPQSMDSHHNLWTLTIGCGRPLQSVVSHHKLWTHTSGYFALTYRVKWGKRFCVSGVYIFLENDSSDIRLDTMSRESAKLTEHQVLDSFYERITAHGSMGRRDDVLIGAQSRIHVTLW